MENNCLCLVEGRCFYHMVEVEAATSNLFNKAYLVLTIFKKRIHRLLFVGGLCRMLFKKISCAMFYHSHSFYVLGRGTLNLVNKLHSNSWLEITISMPINNWLLLTL